MAHSPTQNGFFLAQIPVFFETAPDFPIALVANNCARRESEIRDLIGVLPRDKWLLASQLQKAIRRGLRDVAYATGSALCEVARDYVSGRLLVIAYEDIGVANPPLLALVARTVPGVPKSSTKDAARTIGSLAWLLASSPKSRTACDIASLVAVDRSSTDIARQLSRRSQAEIATLAADRDAPLIKRAVAFRHLVARRQSTRREGSNDLLAVGSAMQVPDEVLRLVVLGRRTHDLNCYLPLAHEFVFGLGPYRTRHAKIDTTALDRVLECALDMYTRVGQSAYRMLIAQETELRSLLDRYLKSTNRVGAVGMLLFHREGSLLDRPITSNASKALLAEVEKREGASCGLTTATGIYAVRRWLSRNRDRITLARKAAFEKALESSRPSGDHG